jgi:hypothetical protein
VADVGTLPWPALALFAMIVVSAFGPFPQVLTMLVRLGMRVKSWANPDFKLSIYVAEIRQHRESMESYSRD